MPLQYVVVDPKSGRLLASFAKRGWAESWKQQKFPLARVEMLVEDTKKTNVNSKS